jgi:methylene-fatty-acyl-phospholipid synthase
MGLKTVVKSKHVSKVKKSKNELKQIDFNTKIAPYVKVITLVSFVLSMHELWQENYFSDTLSFSYFESKFFWLMIFVLSLPHIIYAFIWHFPEKYVEMCKNPCINPADLTVAIVIIGKLLTFVTCISWYLYINDYFLGENPEYPTSPLKLVTGSIMLIVGQWLNSAVFNALGVHGVCYGFKLGLTIPWITGFPFNIGVSNPQYVGCILTNFGIITMIVNPISAKAGILMASFLYGCFYLISGYIETYTGKVQGKIE